MTSSIYDRGNILRLSAAFTDTGGTAADPTGVTLRIKPPDGTVAVYTYPGAVTKDGTGAYHYDLALSESGDWYYRFEGTGALTAASENLFHVYRSNVI